MSPNIKLSLFKTEATLFEIVAFFERFWNSNFAASSA